MSLRFFFATAEIFLRAWHDGTSGVLLAPDFLFLPFLFFLSLLRRSIAETYTVYPGIFLRLDGSFRHYDTM